MKHVYIAMSIRQRKYFIQKKELSRVYTHKMKKLPPIPNFNDSTNQKDEP